MITTRLRNFSFVVLLCAAFASMQAGVLADPADPFDWYCSLWEDGDGYACTECNTGGGLPPQWTANGNCDFSGIQDEEQMLTQAAAYIQDAADACDAACGPDEGYPEFVADYYEQTTSPSDPCYSAKTDPECYFTWGQWGGEAGPYSEWSCSCQRQFWCEC